MNKKYLSAWKLLEDGKIHEAKKLFRSLMLEKDYKAWYDVGGFYYYGLYGYKKDEKKALAYYKKAFLLSGDRAILEDYLKVLLKNRGKLKSILSIIFDKKIFKTLISKSIISKERIE